MLNLELEDGQEHGIDWLFSLGNGESSGGLIQGTTDRSHPTAPFTLSGTGFDANAFIFNHITDKVNARIRLLQQKGRLTTLATPTLLVADNEASRVFIGTKRQYIRSIEPGRVIGTNATTGEMASNLTCTSWCYIQYHVKGYNRYQCFMRGFALQARSIVVFFATAGNRDV